MQYGFREECLERCGEAGSEIWEKINRCDAGVTSRFLAC
jgi:hypothetical protein